MLFFKNRSATDLLNLKKDRDAAFALLVSEADRRTALEQQLAAAQAAVAAESAAKAAEQAKVKSEQERRNALEQQLAAAQAAVAAESAAKTQEAARVKDLQEENDLLLAQLHQVQEELERYFLKNKALESSISEVSDGLRNSRYALMAGRFAAPAAGKTAA